MTYIRIPTEESCNITMQVIRDIEGKGINRELQKYTMIEVYVNFKKTNRMEIK